MHTNQLPAASRPLTGIIKSSDYSLWTSARKMSKALLLGIITVMTLLAGSDLMATTYYSSGNNNPTDLTKWWTGTAGTGTHPADFTSGDTFIIQNGNTYSIPASTTWTVNATTAGTAATVQINSGGFLGVSSGSSTLSLGGNLNQAAAGGLTGTTGGTITFTSSGTWTGSGDLTALKYTFNVNSGVTLDASGMSAGFKMRTGNTVTMNIYGTLIMGTQTINGNANANATFVLGSSGTLVCAHASGLGAITGSSAAGTFYNFTATSKVTLPTTANYTFNGSAAQVTSVNLPATVNNLTNNNSSTGLTLSQATTVNGTLALNTGKLTGNVTLGSSATISGGSSTAYLNGQLTVPFAAPSSVAYTFPVGTASAYSPVSIANFTDAGAGTGTLTASATATANPNPGSGIDGSLYIARYWTLTGSGFTSPTYDFTGTYVAGDIQNGANPANLVVRKWDTASSTWAPPTASSSAAYTVTGTTFTTTFGQFAAGEAQTTIPILDSTTKTAVTNTAVTLGATLENNFSLAITDYGIVWGTSPNPTTANNKLQVGTTTPTIPSAFTANVTGLSAATTIYYRGYAINSSAQTGYSTNNSFLTLANEPTTQASGVVCSTLQNGSIPISWTRGNGSKCIVLVSASLPVSSAPVDGTTYTFNATYGSGTQIGSGNYVAYLGTGTNVTLTGLSTSTTYYVAVYELNGSGGSENYLTASPATGSQLTGATFVTSLNWTGAIDTDWNKTGNWDASLVPDVGTPAIIPSGVGTQPVYSNPMTAKSFGALTSSSTLTIGTNGFVVDGSGNAAALFFGSPSAKLSIATNGVMSIPNGGMTLQTNGNATVDAGGNLSMKGTLIVGVGGNSSTGGGQGFFTNNSGTVSLGGITVNNSGNNQTCVALINGGINDLGAVTVGRSAAGSAPALGTEGLIINNGVVRTTSIDVGGGSGNSWLTMYFKDGLLTNTGAFTVRFQNTASRFSRFYQAGGILVSTNTSVHLRGQTSANNGYVIYAVNGGTNMVGGFVIADTGDVHHSVFLTNNAKLYIGSGGISMGGGSLDATNVVLAANGTFGALADWTNSVQMQMDGGTFNASDLNGNPYNITLSGAVSGAGALTKVGNGTLSLNAVNTYAGNTLINAGKLVVGAGGTMSNSGKFYVGSGATFDVSAVSGGFPLSNQTLAGLGVITGAVNVASSVTYAIDPGSNTLTGTLSFSNSVTETGGAINHFDLAGAPNPNNDLAVIAGDLNVSGTNAVDIGGSSLVVGSIYPIIKYGGNFNGGISNFIVTSVVGTLTNDAVAKTISFIPQATLRGPTNIVWVGNSVNTNWDTEVSTNWLNAGALDFFVPKDTVQFTDVGASNAPINIVGTVTPTSVLVNSRSNYVFASTSGGGIGDSTTPTSLTVTNTGTLTVLTTNTYTGTTTIDGGGALAVSQMANISSASPLGKSDTLVINNGTFIYSGSNASTDHGATLGNTNSAINVSANGSLTLNGTLGGAGGLTKVGPGNLILPNGNSFAGGTFVNAGTLTLNSASSAGAGTITLNGGTLAISAIKPANTINVTASSIITGGNSGGATGIKNVTGSANLLLAVTASSGVFDLTGDMSAYAGTITCSNAGGGTVRLNGSNGSKLATWDLGTGSMELDTRSSTAICYFGALTGGASANLVGHNASDTLTAATYYIGDNGLSTTFQGAIKDGLRAGQVLSIVKTGTGTLTLSGASTYTGATTVSNGTLAVNGSLATASVVTVKGGTLAGGGIIGGATTLNAGAILSAGSNSVGTLTFSGNLTLDAASTNSFAVTTAGGASNSVTVAGTLSPNSSVIKITSGTALAVGTYTLFNYAGVSGSFNATPVFDVAPAATASIVDTGSQIQLVIGTSAGPTISSITTSGADLTLNATGGTAGGSVSVLTSTDLTVPLASWTTVTTGNYDGSGNFSYTVSGALSSGPQQFYILKQ